MLVFAPSYAHPFGHPASFHREQYARAVAEERARREYELALAEEIARQRYIEQERYRQRLLAEEQARQQYLAEQRAVREYLAQHEALLRQQRARELRRRELEEQDRAAASDFFDVLFGRKMPSAPQEDSEPIVPPVPHPTPAPEPPKREIDPEVASKAASIIQSQWHISRARAAAFAALSSLSSSLDSLRTSFTLPDGLTFSEDGKLLFNPVNSPVHAHEHALVTLLAKIDEVDSKGIKEIRQRRKALVAMVEKELAELDQKKEQAWRVSTSTSLEADVDMILPSESADAQVVATEPSHPDTAEHTEPELEPEPSDMASSPTSAPINLIGSVHLAADAHNDEPTEQLPIEPSILPQASTELVDPSPVQDAPTPLSPATPAGDLAMDVLPSPDFSPSVLPLDVTDDSEDLVVVEDMLDPSLSSDDDDGEVSSPAVTERPVSLDGDEDFEML